MAIQPKPDQKQNHQTPDKQQNWSKNQPNQANLGNQKSKPGQQQPQVNSNKKDPNQSFKKS